MNHCIFQRELLRYISFNQDDLMPIKKVMGFPILRLLISLGENFLESGDFLHFKALE